VDLLVLVAVSGARRSKLTVAGGLGEIAVVGDFEDPASSFGTQEGEQNDIGVDATPMKVIV
jgi:hypothetical protein